jgi:hypothetical protein
MMVPMDEPCGPQPNIFFTFREAQDLLGVSLMEFTNVLLKYEIEVNEKGISGASLRKIWDGERNPSDLAAA